MTVTPSAGVPAEAGSVVLNVTVTRPTVSGHLTVFPTGAPRPTSSNLNFSSNQTVPNAVITKVGAGGKITLNAPRGCPHVVIDVLGYHVGAFPR